MTKDYAKKRRVMPTKSRRRSVNSSPNKSNQDAMPGWAWMSTGLVLGLALSGMVYWKLNGPMHSSHRAQNTTEPNQRNISPVAKAKENKNKSKQKQSQAVSEDYRTRFDFYTLLPTMTMDAPDIPPPTTTAISSLDPLTIEDLAPITNPTAQETTTTPLATQGQVVADAITTRPQNLSPQPYIIQAGSFRQLSQAEELKAQLALAGFEARIQTFKMDNKDTRYRVQVGPFGTKDQANAKQQELQQALQLHSLVIKNRV